jgi:hypothetical protein
VLALCWGGVNVTRYLVEAYVPSARGQAVGVAETRVLNAARGLTGEGVAIDLIRTTWILEDETCFHVIDADSIEAVRELCSRAGLDAARVVEAVEHSTDR